MQLVAYIGFDDCCEEAFRYYEKHLGGKIEAMMPYAGSPMENDVPEAARDKIMHARMSVGDAVLMGGDSLEDHYEKPQGMMVTIQLSDPDEAERIFSALEDGGQVRMPMGETFWATRFGMVTDRFGTPWIINCEKPMD